LAWADPKVLRILEVLLIEVPGLTSFAIDLCPKLFRLVVVRLTLFLGPQFLVFLVTLSWITNWAPKKDVTSCGPQLDSILPKELVKLELWVGDRISK